MIGSTMLPKMIALPLGKDEAARDDAVYRNRFRKRRFAQFLAMVDEVLQTKSECRIIDLGGGVSFWLGLQAAWQDRPIHVTLVNLASEPVPSAQFESFAGDSRSMPEFGDNQFDLVHSNSVIEHVGGWSDKKRMAAEVRRLAPRYFVQTPNYWFPMEPHYRTPMIHWLPQPLRRDLVMRGRRGFYPAASTIDDAHEVLGDASLVDGKEMAALFPDARIVRERVLGLTKSLIAIR